MNSLKKTYERFVKLRGNPKAISLGFALGLFIGMSPFMGLHTITAVFFAAILKWNKLSAAVAVFITNPLTAPFIYSYTYLLGKKIMGVNKVFDIPTEFTLNTLMEIIRKTPEIFTILTVGGIISGIPVAIGGYYLSYYAVLRYRKKQMNRMVKNIKDLED